MVGGLNSSIHDRSVTDAVLLSTDIHQHHPSLRYLKKTTIVFLSFCLQLLQPYATTGHTDHGIILFIITYKSYTKNRKKKHRKK